MNVEELLTLAFRPFAEWLCDLLGVRGGERVLDVGCGRGISTSLAMEKVTPNGYVAGVDADMEAIERLKSRFPGEESTRFCVTQAERLVDCFGNEKFDVVISNFSFHLFADMEKALMQMLHVLTSGGRLGIVVPGPDHVTEFRKALIVILQEFDLLEEFRRCGPLVMDKERLTNLVRSLEGRIEAYRILDKKIAIEVEDANTYMRHMEARSAKARILSRTPEQL